MRLIDADRLMRSIDINWGCDECKAHCVDVRGMALCEIHQFKECVEVEPTTFQWIPVSERLPNDDEMSKCIYVNKYGDYIVDAYIHKVGSTYECENDYTILCDVIAWMPLPEPYKESEEE